MLEFVKDSFSVGDLELIRQITCILSVVLAVTLFVVFYIKSIHEEKKKTNAKDVLKQILETTESQLQKQEGKYEEKESYLAKMGVNYAFGRKVSPEEYFIAKILLGVVFCLFFAWTSGFLVGGVGFVIAFYGVDIIVKLSNQSTNEKMLPDIKNMFDTLKIKTEGGMFLTSAIMECYKNARHPRLKQALFEMNGQLITKNDIELTIDEFNAKFNCKQIDILCIILKQSMESGRTVEILKDISDQLADMQKAINIKVKNKMENQTLMIQMVMYTIIIVLCIYGIMISMGSNASLF